MLLLKLANMMVVALYLGVIIKDITTEQTKPIPHIMAIALRFCHNMDAILSDKKEEGFVSNFMLLFLCLVP